MLEEKEVIILKYIDDNLSIEKLNFGRTDRVQVGQVFIKKRCAPGSQNAFRSITKNAKKIGMLVNSSKTQILVISDSLNFMPQVYIVDADGNTIESTSELKVLGFHFGSKPTMHLHVASVLKKMRCKYWALRHLKKVGFNQNELVQVDKTTIRPTADYCSVAYHSLLTDEQDELLERAQVGALRAIFDPKLSGRKLRELADVTTLRECRIQQCDKLAAKCAASDRFSHWFPKREGRGTREQYQEYFARCDRLKNSPLYFMRRRLNGKEGLVYGERNRQFREA